MSNKQFETITKHFICYGCQGEHCTCAVTVLKSKGEVRKPKGCCLMGKYNLDAKWQECCPHCGTVL